MVWGSHCNPCGCNFFKDWGTLKRICANIWRRIILRITAMGLKISNMTFYATLTWTKPQIFGLLGTTAGLCCEHPLIPHHWFPVLNITTFYNTDLTSLWLDSSACCPHTAPVLLLLLLLLQNVTQSGVSVRSTSTKIQTSATGCLHQSSSAYGGKWLLTGEFSPGDRAAMYLKPTDGRSLKSPSLC